jgi:UDP:flavonoid glycosyltransferase YjiC (YdhE family)
VARFLLIPHAPQGTLAHLAACISVAGALRDRGHEVVFAYGGTRPELLDGPGFEWRPVLEAGGAMSSEWFETDEHLEEILASQLAAVEEVRPDACITSAGAGRLTAAVAGVPQLDLMHGLGNSTFGRRGRLRETIRGDLRRPSRAVKDLWLGLRPRRRTPSGEIWLRAWRRHTGMALDPITKWTGHATAVACTTTPLLDPTRGMPEHWRYVGPLSFGPALPVIPAGGRPGGATSGEGERGAERRPRVYVSQGSTGDPELLRRSVAELARAGFQAIASTGGLCDPADLEGLGEGVEAADFRDTRAELRAADVAVIAGGHMTAMEALLAGTPTIVVARTISQALSAKRAERLGTGIGLWPRVPRGSVASAASRVSSRERYRARAAQVAGHLREWNGGRGAAELAEATAGVPVA